MTQSLSARIAVYRTPSADAPLDLRWTAKARVAGKNVWARGATPEAAQDAVRAKLARLAAQDPLGDHPYGQTDH